MDISKVEMAPMLAGGRMMWADGYRQHPRPWNGHFIQPALLLTNTDFQEPVSQIRRATTAAAAKATKHNAAIGNG